jgi:hypothetical protein
MRSFADVPVTWEGKKYIIRANQLMQVIARVEGILTFHELNEFTRKRTIATAKVAMAYGVVLRFLGIDVEDETIYLKMFPSTENPGEYEAEVTQAVTGLMALMMPPDNVVESLGNAAAPEQPGASSKKRTKQPSRGA